MCFEGVFYPGVIANKCFEKVCVEICYANAKITKLYRFSKCLFFKLRIDPIPTSPRQGSWVASVSLYVTDVTVVTEGLVLGLGLDPKNRPTVKEASVKQWMNSSEHHNLQEMTRFTIIA